MSIQVKLKKSRVEGPSVVVYDTEREMVDADVDFIRAAYALNKIIRDAEKVLEQARAERK